MLTKSEAISLLSKNFSRNCCLIEVLKHDADCQLLYAEADGVTLINKDKIILMDVQSERARNLSINLLNDTKVAMTTDIESALAIDDRFKIGVFKKCYQAFWDKTEKIPQNGNITIDKLSVTDYNIKAVMDNYRYSLTKEGVLSAMKTSGIFGAYVDNVLAGFIGFHSEKSMGMLEVFPQYQRMGIGSQLIKKAINVCLNEGRLPFCHIVEDNFKSKSMCQKIGLTFYDGFVYWVG